MGGRRQSTLKRELVRAADGEKSFELEQRIGRLEELVKALIKERAALQAQFDHLSAKFRI